MHRSSFHKTAERATLDRPTELLWRLLERLRNDLTWLREDGYRESLELLSSHFHLDFAGAQASVAITVFPERRELGVWIARPGQLGLGPSLQQCLEARGLSAPPRRVADAAPEVIGAAVDEHAGALKLLRHHELAGDWSD
jgi:hypothetical protein